FKKEDPSWAAFQYPSKANPHLDPDEIEAISRDMPALVRRQEIDAEFVQLAGAMFHREDIRILEEEPILPRHVRPWDLAWTTKNISDYTAGSRMGMMADGTVVIAHIVRARCEWPSAIRLISNTARLDGCGCEQGIEVVGAQL